MVKGKDTGCAYFLGNGTNNLCFNGELDVTQCFVCTKDNTPDGCFN